MNTFRIPFQLKKITAYVSDSMSCGDEGGGEDILLQKTGGKIPMLVENDSLRVEGWQHDSMVGVCFKAVDMGTYVFEGDLNGNPFKFSYQDYVPACLPGRYGDYLEFVIDTDGRVLEFTFNMGEAKSMLLEFVELVDG